MHRKHPRTVSCLALMLGAGTLLANGLTPARPTPAPWQKINAFQPLKVTQALGQIHSQRASLGLGLADTFTCLGASSNASGQTIVRMQQLYQGHKVWGGRAAAKVSSQGQVSLQTVGIMPDINLSGEPALSPAQVTAAAVARLGAGAQVHGTPSAELVVFAPAYRQATSTYRQPTQPQRYIWAYLVKLQGRNSQGLQSVATVLDASTGIVLREDNQFRQAGAPVVPLPAFGTGLGFFSGQVGLNTTRLEDGSYALWDTTRGTLANPQLLSYVAQNTGVWNPIGNQVWCENKDATGSDLGTESLFQKNLQLNGDTSDAWGDGLTWSGDWTKENLANGQTVGTDTLNAVSLTWDFYGNLFNFNGLDNLGTTVAALAFYGGPWDTTDQATDAAQFDATTNVLLLGGGTYPTNPTGFLPLSDLDVIAHEMAHGVTYNTAMLDGGTVVDDEALLNEGTSDFFAQMVKAWSKRGPSDDSSVIPNTGIDWTFGTGINRGTPVRWLYKPSKDGQSPDAWHDGIGYMEAHLGGGVLARALYFLAQGASSTATDDSYSPNLPGGMTGVGNDHAARIWFKVISENFAGHSVGTLKYQDARSAALGAAIDLYGEGSPEAIGVMNAFAAVNVGVASGGTPRTQVVFSGFRNNDWLVTYGQTWYDNRQFFPMGETVRPRVTVNNNANTAVTWSSPGPSLFHGEDMFANHVYEGGTFNADGTWTTPVRASGYSIVATSVADPTQFAEGRAEVVHMDADSDGESDAMDMGGIALGWGLAEILDMNQAIWPGLGAGDEDVAIITDCIKNAWPAL